MATSDPLTPYIILNRQFIRFVCVCVCVRASELLWFDLGFCSRCAAESHEITGRPSFVLRLFRGHRVGTFREKKPRSLQLHRMGISSCRIISPLRVILFFFFFFFFFFFILVVVVVVASVGFPPGFQLEWRHRRPLLVQCRSNRNQASKGSDGNSPIASIRSTSANHQPASAASIPPSLRPSVPPSLRIGLFCDMRQCRGSIDTAGVVIDLQVDSNQFRFDRIAWRETERNREKQRGGEKEGRGAGWIYFWPSRQVQWCCWWWVFYDCIHWSGAGSVFWGFFFCFLLTYLNKNKFHLLFHFILFQNLCFYVIPPVWCYYRKLVI